MINLFLQDSAATDLLLGFRTHEIEKSLYEKARLKRPEGSHKTWGHYLHEGNQTWVGLDPETLQTPYLELKEMCELLKPKTNSTLVDLGAGYGRLGLVLEALYPTTSFCGYEYVSERVEEGKRIFKALNLAKAELHVQDLTADFFCLPPADYYFHYHDCR